MISATKTNGKGSERGRVKPELREEDRQHLREFNRHRDLIRDRTTQVALRHHTSFLLLGPTGTSKTVTVTETLKSLGPDVTWVLWNARVSPMGLWQILREHPESVIVVDDVISLFNGTNKAALQVLLAALGGHAGEARLIKHATHDDRSSFFFHGGIVAIANDLPKRNPMADALVSRMCVLRHEPSEEMLVAFMRNEALRGYRDLAPKVCLEVVDFTVNACRNSDYRIDLRHMRAAWEDYRFWSSGQSEHEWQTLIESNVSMSSRMDDQNPLTKQEEIARELAEVRRLVSKYPGDRARQIHEFSASKATFYNRLKQLPRGERK